MANKVELSKKEVQKSYWLWQLFSHANYNYERMQGTAFAMAMAPILQKLYPKKEDLGRRSAAPSGILQYRPRTSAA